MVYKQVEGGENCDPDVAFPHIDIRLDNVLGHLRKEFEGTVLAKNLGPLFGGYGSFLSTLQSSPPAYMQNSNTKRVPNEAVVGDIENSSCPLIEDRANDDGTELSSANASTPALSPLSIIHIMTSHHIPGYFLVTPSFPSLEDCPHDGTELSYAISPLSIIHIMTSNQIPGDSLVTPSFPSLEDSLDDGTELSSANIMTSRHIPGDSLVTPLSDFQLQLLDSNVKVFAIEPENLEAEFHLDPSTNRDEFAPVKEFPGLMENKGISTVNRRKYIEIKETDTRLGKKAANNLKRPLNSSSKDTRLGKKAANNLKRPLNTSSKGNDSVMEMNKLKQQEKWKLKENDPERVEGDVGQGRGKDEGEPEVHQPLRKTKARVSIDGSNCEKSTNPYISSKTDNLHGALICSVTLASNGVTGRNLGGTVAAGRAALKQARDLKHAADSLKDMGSSDHCITHQYFEAALKFLHGASLLEPFDAENAKRGEMPLSMKLYIDTARLYAFCASTYERNKEMAAAALAYKCMGVSHMRVVLCKNSCLTREWHEFHAAFQNAALGESPSSPFSYVDELNNPHFHRVLQYTQDVSAGFEAFRKSEIAFSAAVVSFGTEKISTVKRAIDFSFHDIDGFLQLVRLAWETIYH